MTREEIRRENARRLSAKVGGKTEFGRFVGLESSQVSQLIGPNPTKNIGNSIAKRIEKAFSFPDGYLDAEHPEMGLADNNETGEPPAPELPAGAARITVGSSSIDVIPIKAVNLRLQAGFPLFEADQIYDDHSTIDLPRQWVEENQLVPNCLLAIKVKGPSMEPMLYEDEIVVINIADTKPVTNQIYAINYDGKAVIKQMVYKNREWWLYSFNHDDEFKPVMCRGAECIVIGKLVYQPGRGLIGKL